MTGREFLRLFLVFAACNGWWAFATWPKLGAGAQAVGPLILFGILPSLVIVILIAFWVFDEF